MRHLTTYALQRKSRKENTQRRPALRRSIEPE